MKEEEAAGEQVLDSTATLLFHSPILCSPPKQGSNHAHDGPAIQQGSPEEMKAKINRLSLDGSNSDRESNGSPKTFRKLKRGRAKLQCLAKTSDARSPGLQQSQSASSRY